MVILFHFSNPFTLSVPRMIINYTSYQYVINATPNKNLSNIQDVSTPENRKESMYLWGLTS